MSSFVSGSLSDRAYTLIRNKILMGEFQLGAPLSRRKLAVELDMSFLPVSEAMQRLESEGLIESRPRVGTRVRIPTAQDFHDRYVIREALEAQAARLFCERATTHDRRTLLAEAEKFEKMIDVSEQEATDPEFQFSFQAAHVALHMRIAESSRCTLLCELLEKNQLLIFNWLYDVAAGYQLERGRHVELMKVLVGDDPDAACLAMGLHVRTGMHDIESAINTRFANPLSQLGKPSRVTDVSNGAAILPWRHSSR